MKKGTYVLLYLAQLSLLVVVAVFQRSPGYMDAEYYFSIAQRMTGGEGMTEPFIWNFLSGSSEIPHPAFEYWKPGPSLLAWLSMVLSGRNDFLGARLIFVLISGFIAPLTARLAYQISEDKKTALFSGILACCSAFYLPFLPTTDGFGIYMICGGFALIFLESAQRPVEYLLLGFTAGIMWLTRVEGLLWLALILFGLIRVGKKKLPDYLLVTASFLVIVLTWSTIEGNWQIFQGGAGRSLWLTDYDQLFAYPPEKLNFNTWAAAGAAALISDRLQAGMTNLQTLVFVQGTLIMFPLVVVGFIIHRNRAAVQTGGAAALMGLALMTVVFPFAGARGGFFHAGSAWQILFWSLAGCGFSWMVDQLQSRWNWDRQKSWRVLGTGFIFVIFTASGYVTWERVVGNDLNSFRWNASHRQVLQIENDLRDLGLDESGLVMINNPPGLYAAAKLSSVVIPDGELGTLLDAAEDFQVSVIILEANHPQGLKDLYNNPRSVDGLTYVESREGVHYFLTDRLQQ